MLMVEKCVSNTPLHAVENVAVGAPHVVAGGSSPHLADFLHEEVVERLNVHSRMAQPCCRRQPATHLADTAMTSKALLEDRRHSASATIEFVGPRRVAKNARQEQTLQQMMIGQTDISDHN